MPQRVTQIPFPGGSGRVPTGALQFEEDWPGLFIRGDEAVALSLRIRLLQERLAGNPDAGVAAALLQLQGIAGLMERDVIVPGAD